MPNIKSAKKRVITSRSNKVANNDYRSSMRTAIKACDKMIHDKNKDEAIKALNLATKRIDKALAKGVIKKNTAARYKSRLALQVNGLK